MAATSNARRDAAIVVKNMQKSYGDLKVLRGVNFSIQKGTIFALLGPNGAGKTTTIKILSTLLAPDSGKATVNGYDVVQQSSKTRSSIGLTGQYAAVDGYLTAHENLALIGRLYRMSAADANSRATKLIKQFDLIDAADRQVKTFSGGMRRRLDLAMSLIANPPIIFLDEPTTGLDPRSRMTMWSIIKQLAEDGTTILLTTQYMEEADQLADNIVVIDKGVVIAEGTANELKSKVGADQLEVTISKKSDFDKAKAAIAGERVKGDPDNRVLSMAAKNGVSKLKQVLDDLDRAKIQVENVSLHRPTLDDVFLTLTGHGTDKEEGEK